MGDVVYIKLQKRLPNLTQQQEQILSDMLLEMYQRGYDDAKGRLCRDCGYKSYYASVAAQNDCNDCGAKRTCNHVPQPGGIVRINCPLWRAGK